MSEPFHQCKGLISVHTSQTAAHSRHSNIHSQCRSHRSFDSERCLQDLLKAPLLYQSNNPCFIGKNVCHMNEMS